MERMRKSRLLVALVSVALLLGMVSVAVSLPVPFLAVTKYAKPASHNPVTIQGADFDCVAECTTDATTTAEIDKRGFPFGSVSVPSASGITTITWYHAYTSGVTAVPYKDQDGVAVTLTVAGGAAYELPSAIAGVPFLVPVTNDDGNLYFHFER